MEEKGEILHVIDKEIESGSVLGKIDWDRRFDHMQQHSGQHILSQCSVQLFDAETRSFHLGERASTLEISMNKITEEDVERLEELANRIVFQNKEIKSQLKLPK